MKYVDFDSSITDRCNIIGYYDPEIHGSRLISVEDANGSHDQPNPGTLIPARAIEITEEQWQLSIDTPGAFWVNVLTLAFEPAPPLPPAEVLANNQEVKRTVVRGDCQVAIESGIIHDALGAQHFYPTKQLDQQNLTALVLRAERSDRLKEAWQCKFWCADRADIWRRRDHTAAQIISVGEGVLAHTQAQQDSYGVLLTAIDAALDAAELDTILW